METASLPLFRSLLALAQSTPRPPDEMVHFGPLNVDRATWALLGRAATTALTIVVALVLLRLVPVLERLLIRWASRQEEPTGPAAGVERRQRVETLTRVVGSVARSVIWSMTVIAVLGDLGVAIGPLLAGAGIAGVAIGFGAQSIVKDFFAGFFILLENQYAVGDTVTIVGVTGTVERMTMRITVLRDANGTAYFIPNSGIANVTNRTYGWGRAIVDVSFAREVSEADARAVLEAAAARALEVNGLRQSLLEPPTPEGPLEFSPGGIAWRLVGKTQANHVAEAKRVLITALNEELRARGFVSAGAVLTHSKLAA
jgi:small conductance mechanosensitive channel